MLVSPSGKVYIGQTRRKKVGDRWRAHKNRSHDDEAHCRALYAAIRLYGWHSFKKVVLATAPDGELNKLEVEFIQQYDSFKNGYNLTPGGDYNPMLDADVRARLSATCSTPEKKAETSSRIKGLHADPEWHATWLEAQREAHRTEEHRAGQSDRSRKQWAKEKAAGIDRGKAISAALKAKVAATGFWRSKEGEDRRKQAIREGYELKKLLAHRIAVSRLRDNKRARSASPCLRESGTLAERHDRHTPPPRR